jgi:hypothetical protein
MRVRCAVRNKRDELGTGSLFVATPSKQTKKQNNFMGNNQKNTTTTLRGGEMRA